MKYLLFLILVLLAFTVPFFQHDYIFDWDQANDYTATASISSGKLTLIGPRVTSDQGFFLGPWHYYFLLPFYKITSGSLYMGFWAALFVQSLFVITAFFMAKKWFGTLAGLMVGLLVATSSTLIEWGFMYVPLLSLLFFYLCLKTLKNPATAGLPLLFFFFGFGCTIYTVFYALGIPLAYVTLNLFISKKTSIKNIIFGTFFFLLPYTPLLIFDLRHDFLNFKNIFGFLGSQSGQGTQFGYFIIVFFKALGLSWLNWQLPLIISILTLIILILGISLFNKNKLFVTLWLVSSLIPLAFYHGNVSEYYYAPVVLLVPFFLSGLLSQKGKIGKIILIIFVISLIGLRLNHKFQNGSGVNLTDKIELVNKLESLGAKYSISYELPLGQDSGYNTVFKTLGTNFVPDGSSPLYTITYPHTPLSGTKIITTSKLAVYKR